LSFDLRRLTQHRGNRRRATKSEQTFDCRTPVHTGGKMFGKRIEPSIVHERAL
jgi:hypothetical protein